jgi:hypothetical protein
MNQTKDIKIVKDEANPQPDQIIAQAIINLAACVDQLVNKGPLTERAIILLLKDKTNMALADIQCVLRAIPRLKDYVNTARLSPARTTQAASRAAGA